MTETPADIITAMFEEYIATRDTDLRNQLVEAHVQLVRYVAQRMLPQLHSSVELQDLVSYGMFGLIDAVERYDPARGVKFSTFASYRINGSITDEMRSQAWEPRSVRALHRQSQQAIAALEVELGRLPLPHEVATRVGVEVDEIRRAEREMHAARVGSLSTPIRSEGESLTLGDVVVFEGAGDSEPLVNEMAESVSRALGRMRAHERILLQLIYVGGMMLKDIAEVLEVGDSWVSHLHTRAIISLQRILAGQY